MLLYLAIRWGNADSPDGPDGEDTIVLVRAATVAEAGEVADQVFVNLPTTSPHSQRPVQPFCHVLREIGAGNGMEGPGVILGPFVAGPGQWAVGTADRRSWERDDQHDEWCERASST